MSHRFHSGYVSVPINRSNGIQIPRNHFYDAVGADPNAQPAAITAKEIHPCFLVIEGYRRETSGLTGFYTDPTPVALLLIDLSKKLHLEVQFGEIYNMGQ